jgi:hypothetical protein
MMWLFVDFRELLAQKVFPVPYRAIFKRREDFIAQLFIERTGLETERRQLHVPTSSLSCVGLGCQQQLASIALSTNWLGQPEDRDPQPLPPEMTQHTPQDRAVRILEKDREPGGSTRRNPCPRGE